MKSATLAFSAMLLAVVACGDGAPDTPIAVIPTDSPLSTALAPPSPLNTAEAPVATPASIPTQPPTNALAPTPARTPALGGLPTSTATPAPTPTSTPTTVPTPRPAPDLAVSSPEVGDSNAKAGQPLTLSVTVRNQGNGSSGQTVLIYYRSTDSIITSDDAEQGAAQVAVIRPSGISHESISLTAPSAPGTYYYGACVEAVPGESSGGNNCSHAIEVTVLPLPPDLVVDLPTASEGTPFVGHPFRLSVNVRNQGSGSSGTVMLVYYRSENSLVTSGDIQEGTVQISGLHPSERSHETISLNAPSSPGTYYYGACAIWVSSESHTTHSCSQSVSVTVLPLPPDLVVDTPTVSASGVMANQLLVLEITLRNQGIGSSGPTTLVYYSSTDPTVTSGHARTGTVRIPGMNVSESSKESVLTYAPSAPGTYYYWACVESVPSEIVKTNNCSSGVKVTVSEFRMENVPWVRDGLTEKEQPTMERIRILAQVNSSMAQRVAGSPWLSDGISDFEESLIRELRSVASTWPKAAVLMTTVPDRNGHLIDSLVRYFRYWEPERMEQIISQPWFQDGVSREEAALIAVQRETTDFDVIFYDLLRDGHVRSETISLPLAGDVDIFVVGRMPSGLDDTVERLAFGMEVLEGYLGIPWPKPVVLALLELDSDLGRPFGGWYAGTHIVLKNETEKLAWHELSHYYFSNDPFWFREAAAEFLAYYVKDQKGSEPISSAYFESLTQIAKGCAPYGMGDVRGWMNATFDQRWARIGCLYDLSFVFMNGLNRLLGDQVIWSTLNEIYKRNLATVLGPSEDEIYEAFLGNTPKSQQEELQACYTRLHGHPIPGYTPAPNGLTSAEERDALAALYHATNGPGWKNSENWLSAAPLHKWYGVTTECDGSVVKLELDENQLTGSIPPELRNLSSLQTLSLDRNQLSGPIPSTLSNLSSLAELRLSRNQFTGPILPELGSLSNLKELHLFSNRLSGSIPSELGRLSGLRDLLLGDNELTGPIPLELAGLFHLTSLSLRENQLTGSIPPELGRLSNLTFLSVRENQLSGSIPSELSSLSELEYLWLAKNQFVDCVPQGLGDGALNDIDELGVEACVDS